MVSRAPIRRFAPQLILALVLLLALASAVAMARGISSKPATKSTPAVLHWANEGISDLYTLDPARGPDFNARQAVQLIFGGLVRFGPLFQILPDAAARWEVSKDGRTYTFYLRPQVRFGDGTLLTAQDVAYSFNRTLGPPFTDCSAGSQLSDIQGAADVSCGRAKQASGIRVLNPRTIRIRLRRADGSFLAKLANPDGYIVPPWRVRADPGGWDQQAIGTGPFMVGRWVHNNALLLVPNPYYYGGKLQLDGIDMPFIPEPLTAYKRYRAGAVDIMGIIHFPTEVLYDVQGRPDFHQSARLETVYLTLNERTPPFGDARVRLAFAHALDKTALVRAAYGNFAHPTDGMMPPGLPGYNPALHGASFNPALARRLLAQAGFPGGRGLPAITYPVDQDAQSVVLASALAAQWRRVLGVRVRLVQHTHSDYLKLLTLLDYQIAVIDWTADYPDPENFLSQLLHSGTSNNNGRWSNPTFDRLTDLADSMPLDDPARAPLYRRAEEIAMDQAATIPLANPTAGILVRRSVHGLQISGGYLLARDWTRVTVSPGGQR